MSRRLPGSEVDRMFKFLHAADIHLDSPLRGLDRYEGAPSGAIRGASRRAMENLVRLALAERVDFVVIAGDVYDGDWPDHNTGLWFVARMAELRDAKIEVFLIRGNHDARNKMTRDLRLPDNVTSLGVDRPETRHHRALPVAVHGQGFATAAVREDLAAGYPAADPGCFNLGLLHTSANGREGHEPYAPCTVDSLRSKGYGYWALGHVHTRETLDDRDAPIVFPGNIQGRHAREPGAKGCVLVTVEGREAKAEFRALDVLRWETCRVDASGLARADDVLERFEALLPALIEASDDRLLALRVEVVGETEAHGKLAADPVHWTNEVRAAAITHGSNRVWVEKVRFAARAPRIGGPEGGSGPFAEIDRLLGELRDDPTALRAFAAAELGDLRKKLPADLKHLDGVDLEADDWLLAVLGGVRPLLARRFEATPPPPPPSAPAPAPAQGRSR